MPVTAREAAYLAIEAFRRRNARPDMVLANLKDVEQRDRALANNIVNGVLQQRMLLDYYISRFSGRSADKLTPEVLDILRLSAYQIIFLGRGPARAAVSEGVELTKRRAPRAAGLVNAVLRKFSEGTLPEIEADSREEYLAVKYSHPVWLVRALTALYGGDTCERILEAGNTQPPVTAQVNTLKCDAKELAEKLRNEGVETESCPYLEDALYLKKTGPVEELQAFRDGLFYVQDPAARFATMVSGAKAGGRVLDLCAAPGGKSFAAAIAMKNEGVIRSFDIHEKKATLIKKGAERLGISVISAKAGDAGKLDPELCGWADTVIADVPCSGFGVIRKKPEIRYKDEKELERLPEIQLRILNNAGRYVRPGGTLLYSTCTILPRENEEVVGRFLEENGEFIPESFTLPEPFGEFPGMGTILPHTGHTDGFFICLMRKKI